MYNLVNSGHTSHVQILDNKRTDKKAREAITFTDAVWPNPTLAYTVLNRELKKILRQYMGSTVERTSKLNAIEKTTKENSVLHQGHTALIH